MGSRGWFHLDAAGENAGDDPGQGFTLMHACLWNFCLLLIQDLIKELFLGIAVAVKPLMHEVIALIVKP